MLPLHFTQTLAKPREAIRDIRNAPDLNRLCAMVWDEVMYVINGTRPYADADKMTQQLVSFVVQAGGELIKSDRGYAESGVYRIEDARGQTSAFKMVRLNGEISVHRLRIRSFDDLTECANGISSDRVHSWSTNRLTNVVFDLQRRIGVFGMLDSIPFEKTPKLDVALSGGEELVNFLAQHVGIDAMRTAQKGAKRLGTQSIYFRSVSRYVAMTFAEVGGGLKVTEEIYHAEGGTSSNINHGTVHGMTLDMLNYVMFGAV